MSRRILCLLAAVTTVSLMASVAQAQSPLCQQLWVERNSIFKQHGYCFKTARAISQFGNAGCQVDNERDLRMSQSQRARVAAIVREERNSLCR